MPDIGILEPSYVYGTNPLDGDENVVETGQISFDGGSDMVSIDGDDGQVYGDYVIKNRYEKDGHRYMMPVTSPTGLNGATVSFIQLGNPTLLWISDWTASRAGLKPFIPAPLASDPDWVLLDEHVEPEMVVVDADAATPVYRISGTYVFGHKNPSASLNENCNWARPPWLEDEFDRSVPSSLYQENLIDQAGGQQQGATLEFGVSN